MIKAVPTLSELNRLALKYIFDKLHVDAQEERELDEGIQCWVRKVDLTAYEKRELQIIIDCLIHDKEGRFDSEKFAYRKAEIDYRKVYKDGI